MRFNELPVDHVAEQRIDVGIHVAWYRTMELEILDSPNTRHELDAQQMGEREDGVALCLRITVDGVRSNVRFIALQPV